MMKQFTTSVVWTLLCLCASHTHAQTQTVRGNVSDKIAQTPIPGAIVRVVGIEPVLVTQTDADGNFTLKEVPVGNRTLQINYAGYQEVVLPHLAVNAGKELVLTIFMEESIDNLEEVVVTAKTEKNKPLNEMSTVSTRTFSVEETRKFAAAVNDPARMASSFAGVVTAGDGSNHISIRGNSPNGLQWRMEGVEIPNPNHFSNVGTAGGGISILSSQLLSNSDFSTGAFAAEYGNALSGVFDLRLRKGNNEKREYTVQLGVLGMDVAAEGPFKKGYEGSYLINYRYSTLNVLGKMGVPIGDASTNFQDLSFNMSLPAGKIGKFGVFGFGGLSYQTTESKKDSLRWEEDAFNRMNSRFYSNTGAVGVTHQKLFANQSYLKTALVFSGTENGYNEDELQDDYTSLVRNYEQRFVQNKVTLSVVYTRKLNVRHNFRTGVVVNRLGYRLQQADMADTNILLTQINASGQTQTIQEFFQWNYRVSDKWTTNLGLHYFQVLLNNTQSLEPRASVKYDATSRHHLTIGYGLHSQIQPLGVYFTEIAANGPSVTSNRNLRLSKAHHMVVGHDWNLSSHTHLKTELYYQFLYDIPVAADTSSRYSILNQMNGYEALALQNTGHGKNYGVELTLERFTHRNLYYLVSVSLYESKFSAANGEWYDTRYNTNYATTITAGKEWELNGKGKNRVLGFNVKSVLSGGFRYTPVNLEASMQKGETVFDNTQVFTKQMPAYYRLDLRLSLKRNYRRVTTTVALDLQNTTNRKNTGGQYYDLKTGSVKYWYQTPLIPVLSYRLEF